jgi:2,5-diketo-D-gluconate reductase A
MPRNAKRRWPTRCAWAIAPAVNQIETHPFCQQRESARFLRENGVQIESWGPFAEGRNALFSHPVLTGIAARHGRSVAQIVLRWLMQRGVVAIPKSVRPERIAENFRVFDFELDAADMAALAALDTGKSAFFDHRDPAIVKWLGEARRNS